MRFFNVENREKSTLLNIIKENVEPGSVVILDKAAAYVNFKKNTSHIASEDQLKHFWVNYTQRFVNNLDNFIHTNGIEGIWKRLR